MVGNHRRGYRGLEMRGERPTWAPLLEAVGERLAQGFMWMFEVRLDDGSWLHAYKHCDTRCYLFLTETARAFEWAACELYVPILLDFAIQRALCGWWILSGWEPEDVDALRDAVGRAQAKAHGTQA